VPFYVDDHRPDAPVLGLGGPMPYIVPGAGASGAPDVAGGRPTGGADASRALGRAAPVYNWTRPNMLSPALRGLPARVWVPNARRRAVELIDPRTFHVVRRLRVGNAPRQVVPSWDLKTLWVSDASGGTLVPVDARTGHRGRAVAVASPHDLYFTPDGRTALVMTGLRRIDFRDPRTMRLRHSLKVPCDGVGHADFSVTGDFLIATCERSGRLVRVDPLRRTVTGVLLLHHRAAPQDVRLSPDGTVFYVSDPAAEGVWVVDAERFGTLGFIRTGPGAGGLTPSRDGKVLYVSGGGGVISLIGFSTRRVVGRWRLPYGGSAGSGGVSADGKVLWVSGRSPGLVHAISTETGRPIRAVRAGDGSPGLCVFPQPGRYSLGHTGNFR
jgi:DNA-binding beta-propeller fold protein YncE